MDRLLIYMYGMRSYIDMLLFLFRGYGTRSLATDVGSGS